MEKIAFEQQWNISKKISNRSDEIKPNCIVRNLWPCQNSIRNKLCFYFIFKNLFCTKRSFVSVCKVHLFFCSILTSIEINCVLHVFHLLKYTVSFNKRYLHKYLKMRKNLNCKNKLFNNFGSSSMCKQKYSLHNQIQWTSNEYIGSLVPLDERQSISGVVQCFSR